jgi:hypothetical protein
LCVTLVIYQESLHDAQSTKCKTINFPCFIHSLERTELQYFTTRNDRLLPFDTNKGIQMKKNSKLENDFSIRFTLESNEEFYCIVIYTAVNMSLLFLH